MFSLLMSIVPITTDKVLQVANTYLPAPHILFQLGSLLKNHYVALEEITSRLKRDPALTAQLIRIANSAVYTGIEPVASVEDAVTLIGFKDVHRIVGYAMLEKINSGNLSVYHISSQRYRENSLLAALLMEELAKAANQDPQSCYTVGLLRSIGKVCLDRLAQGRPASEIPQLKDDLNLADWERCVFGISSNGAGATILKAWRFPSEFISAVSDHYGRADNNPLPLTQLLSLAASITQVLGFGLEGESGYWIDSEAVYREAGVDPKRADPMIAQAFEKFNKLIGKN
jgi:HD-like signal output (HDOD) protein